jgi:hypothetical protein
MDQTHTTKPLEGGVTEGAPRKTPALPLLPAGHSFDAVHLAPALSPQTRLRVT